MICMQCATAREVLQSAAPLIEWIVDEPERLLRVKVAAELAGKLLTARDAVTGEGHIDYAALRCHVAHGMLRGVAELIHQAADIYAGAMERKARLSRAAEGLAPALEMLAGEAARHDPPRVQWVVQREDLRTGEIESWRWRV